MSKHDRLPWDAEELYPTEGARRRAYRRLQSWYREQRLGAPYAWTKARSATASRGPVPARRVGSRLERSWVKRHPDANFLHPSRYAPEIDGYVRERVPFVRRAGGSLDPRRLRENMLSSMPLCFNLFAPLRGRPNLAVDLLRNAFGIEAIELLNVAGILGVECEWAPPAPYGIGDRTAFDAVIAYRDESGRRGLLGIETKYTEPFSQKQYGKPGVAEEEIRRAQYQYWTRPDWFKPGAGDRLYRSATNQLWRNVMLAAACEELPDIDHARVAVVSLHGDPHANAALAGVRHELLDQSRLLDASIERLVRLATIGELQDWSEAFSERYTNVGRVLPADVGARDRLQRRLDDLFPSGCLVLYDTGFNEPYPLDCPHPVATIADGQIAIHLWRVDGWAGTYPVGLPIESHHAGSDASVRLELDGGRFILCEVVDAELRDAMGRARLTAQQIAAVRAY